MKAFKIYSTLPGSILPPTRAYIDLDALTDNYRRLSSGVKAESICVVKADAYGHTCELCAPALYKAGCRRFAVATVAEAVALREILGEALVEILILGYTDPDYASALSENRITQCVYSLEYARALSAAAAAPIGINIKLDTGMNRIGFSAQSECDAERTVEEILTVSTLKNMKIFGMFTHFSRADELTEESDAFTLFQFERFMAVDRALKARGLDVGFRHVCNSAGALRFPQLALDGVRLGILLYGGGSHMTKLSPVMRLETRISHIHKLSPGERVGYGGRFSSDTERTIATLPIGYADGFRRSYTGAFVTVIASSGSSCRAPIVGNICMDQCMIDVTGSAAAVGDRVVLFGDDRARISGLARRSRTIDYECLCQISARVPRINAKEEKL